MQNLPSFFVVGKVEAFFTITDLVVTSLLVESCSLLVVCVTVVFRAVVISGSCLSVWTTVQVKNQRVSIYRQIFKVKGKGYNYEIKIKNM